MNIEYITWLSGCAPSGSLSASAPGLAQQLQTENLTQLLLFLQWKVAGQTKRLRQGLILKEKVLKKRKNNQNNVIVLDWLVLANSTKN